ncbi:MAG: V4R domain-containing protein [Promethearchaeota archaeon]
MNRILLEEMLRKMKQLLEKGEDIGNLKIGALYALGNQLDAIYYFMGHELGGVLEPESSHDGPITQSLVNITQKYHLGIFHIEEENAEHITFSLEQCSSCKDIGVSKLQIPQGFCAFEAGLYAGIVEKMTGKHCFAQELECRLQGTTPNCKFMIVIPPE